MMFPYYRVELKTGPMIDHRRCLHGPETAIVWEQIPVNQTENFTQVFEVSLPKVMEKCQ